MFYYHFENSKHKNKKRNSTEFNAWIDSSDRLTVIKGFQVHLICIQCNHYSNYLKLKTNKTLLNFKYFQLFIILSFFTMANFLIMTFFSLVGDLDVLRNCC